MARNPILHIVIVSVAATAMAAEEPPAGRGRIVFDPKSADWVEVAPPEPGTDAGDLALARTQLAEREYDKARKSLATWRKTYVDSPLWPEGLFHSADAEVYAADEGQGADLWRAHEWYQEILTGYGGTEVADRSLRREMIVAEMFLFRGHKRKVLGGMFRVSAVEEALEILNRIADDYAHGTPLAEQALRMQADYHYQAGEFADAERVYARLARDFPRGRYERLALERSADSAFASFSGVEFDDAPLLEAEERYGQYLDRYPKASSEHEVPQRLEAIRRSRAEKEFKIGQYYERAGEQASAVFYYRFVDRTWPDTLWAEKARERLAALSGDAPPASMPTTEATTEGPVVAPPDATPPASESAEAPAVTAAPTTTEPPAEKPEAVWESTETAVPAAQPAPVAEPVRPPAATDPVDESTEVVPAAPA